MQGTQGPTVTWGGGVAGKHLNKICCYSAGRRSQGFVMLSSMFLGKAFRAELHYILPGKNKHTRTRFRREDKPGDAQATMLYSADFMLPLLNCK